MVKYRLSASMIKKWKSCPFSIYCKITEQIKDVDTEDSYGVAGNVVHKSLEHYYTHLLELEREFAILELQNYFDTMWGELNIGNPSISKDEYWLCVVNGVKANVTPTDMEMCIEIDDPVVSISYLDIVDTNKHEIGDWKTSTYKAKKLEEYKEQLKYYAWAYYKKFGILPTKCWVYFNKHDKPYAFKFSKETLAAFEKELIQIKKDIDKGFEEQKFQRNASRNNCFFCPYKTVCATDLLRASKAPEYPVKFHLKKEKLLVEAAIPDILHRKFEAHINFELKNAHFIKQAMMSKGIRYDAIKRLYKRKDFGAQTTQGFLHYIHTELKTWTVAEGKKLVAQLIDYRDQDVMLSEIDKDVSFVTDFKLYKYQEEAAEMLIKKRWGICEVGTGGGKTAIAALCIQKLKTRTLFVIDNKDLLYQTKKEYEAMLPGLTFGIVGMGLREWDKDVVLATIQTLAKDLKLYAGELEKFNLVIFDETHIIAAKSFEQLSKYLINTKYRFGFSATAKRDDGNDKVIYANTGEVVFKKNALSLIEEGRLVNPTIIFHNYTSKQLITDTWQNEYNDGIVGNEERNKIILHLANLRAEGGKQVMILCKLIKHCEFFASNIPGAELIYGQTEDDVRIETLERFKKGELRVLVGNLKIFNKGINIKNLDTIINAAGNAGDVLTVQTIGRVLRKSPGKDSAEYLDFIDKGEYLYKHSISRMNALKAESYTVTTTKIDLNVPVDIKE